MKNWYRITLDYFEKYKKLYNYYVYKFLCIKIINKIVTYRLVKYGVNNRIKRNI